MAPCPQKPRESRTSRSAVAALGGPQCGEVCHRPRASEERASGLNLDSSKATATKIAISSGSWVACVISNAVAAYVEAHGVAGASVAASTRIRRNAHA